MIRVLIADDETLVREGIRMLLEAVPEVGVVAEAVDGDDALARLRTDAVDVGLLDVRMPRRSGIEDGGDVLVRSAHGEVRGPARLDEAVGRGHVSVPHGWGDTNVNVLTSKDDVDLITGMPLYSGLDVTLSAVGHPAVDEHVDAGDERRGT